ncbi:hypothetical protein GCM10022215_37350 [Nocardioides fonticola]|uniref:Uncharacterized protein n=1 Tax=Nocardioides fonticola TaxID=450363 RepID=A0ABP7XXD4_9ACTN
MCESQSALRGCTGRPLTSACHQSSAGNTGQEASGARDDAVPLPTLPSEARGTPVAADAASVITTPATTPAATPWALMPCTLMPCSLRSVRPV